MLKLDSFFNGAGSDVVEGVDVTGYPIFNDPKVCHFSLSACFNTYKYNLIIALQFH